MREQWSHLNAISNCKISPRIRKISAANLTLNRNLSAIYSTEDLRDFVEFLESHKNYEKSGVPKGAGIDSGEGFDNVSCFVSKIFISNISLDRFSLGLAFSLFEKVNVDIAVIEAGLGGARDATNVIESSNLAASIITTIAEEHMAALGGSLESIAEPKSGIFKHNFLLISPLIDKVL